MKNINYASIKQELRIQNYKNISNFDNIVKLGIDTYWNELCSQINTTDVDPTDIFSEELENLKNTEYSMRLMNICCLSETWEQDLYNYLKEKNLINIFSNDYGRTKQIFERVYPSCTISNYSQIEEMRALVNAIKHGEGNSFNLVRNLTSDQILADSNIGIADSNGIITKKKQIEFDSNALTSRTLNIDGKLESYTNEIIQFWKDVFEAEKQMLNNRSFE